MPPPGDAAGPAGAGVDDARARLYGLPLEEFTAARNALAKQLARGGDKAAAEEVKRLAKPSKTAWALNQLARRQPDDIEQLLAAGERLREAQQQALAGDASQLRAASRAEQDQVDRVLDAAVALAGGGGGSGATRDRLRNTLRAAATDPATGDLLRQGRLVADVEPSGFGLDGLPDTGFDVLSRPKPAATDRSGEGRTADEEGGDAEAARAEAAEAAERARRQAHREAQREAERLRRDAERHRDRATRLLEQAETAARRAQETRQQADAAVRVAEEADAKAVDAAGRAAALEPR